MPKHNLHKHNRHGGQCVQSCVNGRNIKKKPWFCKCTITLVIDTLKHAWHAKYPEEGMIHCDGLKAIISIHICGSE